MPETRRRTQRSCRFAKHEKLAILAILAKGEHMKLLGKAKILELAESDIFCEK